MRRGRVIHITLLAMVIIYLFAGPAAADWGKKEFSVTCYAGPRNNNQYLGTVDVYDASGAASHCNVMYNDCHGNCTGCYQDESSREICVDNSVVPYINQ
jgi:hypothetical protein